MENAKEWTRLLEDCFDGKVDLIITQKVSNVSKKPSEISFCARILAAHGLASILFLRTCSHLPHTIRRI
jgi:hypothetical protein